MQWQRRRDREMGERYREMGERERGGERGGR